MRPVLPLLLIGLLTGDQSAACAQFSTQTPARGRHGEVAVRVPKESYVGLPVLAGFVGAFAGELGDPATARIPGCRYEAKSGLRQGPALVCQICGGETDIRDLDFTRGGSVWLYVSVPNNCPATTITRLVVSDDRFAGGPNVNVINGDLINVSAPTHILDRVFADDTFDGRFAPGTPGTMEALRINVHDGNETWVRDAFLNIPGRPVSDGFGQAATPGHNKFLAEGLYLSGMTLAARGDHGELFEFGKSQPGAVPVEMTYRHNVLIAPAVPATNTALLWLGSGDHSGPLDIDTATLDGNILVAEADGPRNTASRIIGVSTAKIERLIVTHNAIWAHGSFFCIIDEHKGVVRSAFTDNINLFDGSPITQFDSHAGSCAGTRAKSG